MLTISPNEPFYKDLTEEEIEISSILRLTPSQYLHIKQKFLEQVQCGPFKKRDAKSWFRIDVNKVLWIN
jgi:hypothetical protein